MANQAIALGGQAAGRDIKNSPQNNSGQIGIVGDGASGNLIIQNLHVHFGFPIGEPEIDHEKTAMATK